MGASPAGAGGNAAVPQPPLEQASCREGLDATFVQLSSRDMERDAAQWKEELAPVRAVGMTGIVIQYSGDERGSYDARRAGATPVRALLAAAEELSMKVIVGLYSDERWSERIRQPDWLPPPLDNSSERERLFALCAEFSSCLGWYIPQEIEDYTWGEPEGAQTIARMLSASVAVLREAFPWRVVAVAPYYAETLAPEAYAAWWGDVLRQAQIDIVMMQDGAGARGTSVATIQRLLSALGPVAHEHGVGLWSVAELFRQTGGSPVNDDAFSAVPVEFDPLRERLGAIHPLADRVIAFSLLDYMAPDRGRIEEALFQQYMLYCAGMK